MLKNSYIFSLDISQEMIDSIKPKDLDNCYNLPSFIDGFIKQCVEYIIDEMKSAGINVVDVEHFSVGRMSSNGVCAIYYQQWTGKLSYWRFKVLLSDELMAWAKQLSIYGPTAVRPREFNVTIMDYNFTKF